MTDYWLDADVFITPKNGYYSFDIAPGFWRLLEQAAARGIASPTAVYDELIKGTDPLADWVKARKDSGLFLPPDAAVQASMTEIANYVNATYRRSLVTEFLGKADSWLIAHAKAKGGKVVTFENRLHHGTTKLKIPSICDHFHVTSINLFAMMRTLGAELELKRP